MACCLLLQQRTSFSSRADPQHPPTAGTAPPGHLGLSHTSPGSVLSPDTRLTSGELQSAGSGGGWLAGPREDDRDGRAFWRVKPRKVPHDGTQSLWNWGPTWDPYPSEGLVKLGLHPSQLLGLWKLEASPSFLIIPRVSFLVHLQC